MIQRYQTSTLAKVGSLLGMALLNLFWLGFILLALSESNILGVLFFGALFVGFAYFPYTLFVRGRIHEAYLLSGRTLAVVHPRRQTRFLKPRDFVKFCPDSENFVLNDGTKFRFWIPKHAQTFRDNLIRQWYGEAQLATCLSTKSAAISLPKPLRLPAYLGLGSVLSAAIYSGATENWFSLKIALATLLGSGVVFIFWTVVAGLRASCPLEVCEAETEDDNRDALSQASPTTVKSKKEIRRFPQERPEWIPHSVPSLLLLLFLALIVVPTNLYVARYLPGAIGLMVISAVFILPIGIYIGLRWYKNFVRGDLFTTALLSSRTLAVVRPKHPTRYIKQANCVAYQPGTDSSSSRLILREGTQVGFGLADLISDPPGPMLTIWRRWWPYIPEEKLTTSPLPVLITLCTIYTGIMLFFFGAAQRSDSLILLSFALLLGVPIYYAIRFFKKPYTISLRAGDYPDKT